MNKREYFLWALKNDLFRYIEWINDAFAVSSGGDSTYQPKLKRDKDIVTTVIDGAELTLATEPGKSLLDFWEPLTLQPGELPTVRAEVETTYGEAFFNMYVLYSAFGTKVEYMAGRMSVGRLESAICPRVVDDPEDLVLEGLGGSLTDPIYTIELERFVDNYCACTATNRLTVPSMSDKALTIDPAIIEYRDKRIAELKAEGKYNTEEMIRLEGELTAMDKESFKGDESEGFYVNPGKSFGNTRKKVHVMTGVEPDFVDPSILHIGETSLMEGKNIEDIPRNANSARGGSFSRGALTALAGQTAKEAQRATQDLKITMGDCGTKEFILFWVNETHIKSNFLVGRYRYDGPLLKVIDEADLRSRLHTFVSLRDPNRCKAGKLAYCGVCCGTAMAETPDAAGAEVTEMNNVFMNTMMKAMHNTAQTLAPYVPSLYIS